MDKINKRMAVSILTIILTLTSVPVQAAEENVGYSAHTQQEAVDWVNSQLGKSLDYDGVYGAQCVDLIKYYYGYFGVANYATGNANAYITRSLPSGWTRVYGGYKPGDIAVWKTNHSCGTCSTGGYGHIGIITSADSVGFNAVNQNFNGKNYCTQNWFRISALACGIRPVFSNSEANLSYGNVKTTFVDTWNAGLYGEINNPGRITVPTIGAYIWDSNNNLVVSHRESCGRSNPVIYQSLNIVGEAYPKGLQSGKTYTYQLWAQANGKTYYSGKSSFTIKDNQKPTLSNVKVSNISTSGYTITCTATDNNIVNRVQFPTWTVYKGQDDLASQWQTNLKCKGVKRGNTYTYRVNRSAHNNEYGSYRTYIYAYDNAGNYSKVAVPYIKLVELSRGAIREIKSPSAKKLYLKWNRNSRATGYQICYAQNEKFIGSKTIKITKNTITSQSINSLLTKKTYYAKVRSYKNLGKYSIYSAWSSVKKCKIK